MNEAVRHIGQPGHASDPALGNSALEGMHEVMGEILAWRRELQERHRHPAFAVPVPTINLGHIHGGDNPNRICGDCELLLDLRVLPGLKVEELHEDCRTELQYTCTIRDYALERTIVYFLAEVEPGEVRLGNENHGEARWVAPQEAWELLTETSPEQLPALDAALAYWQQK